MEFEYSTTGVWNVLYSKVIVWNVRIQGKENGMRVFKGRIMECEYSIAEVWNTSIQGQEY